MLPCLNKTLLGVECYGCGGQRAAVLLFQGNFKEAFIMYPAIYSLVLFAIFLIFNIFYKFKGDFNIKIAFILFNASVMIISYIIKMVQFYNLTN
ncbi:DUF2752 domain-containing protein [Zunongwangia endophytica]|uniref:DUF2752 domain-containing protein n=1 Tax=Zunongwangia endophytica TaxID=1808945 RepID=A0ABV8H694_9FLAO|nr:DUF2752 domain-containing protein [Zunongwangia endophytica]MDN3594612.1 DUF2752 domain-containing protein [Zunongwangia endophytica]